MYCRKCGKEKTSIRKNCETCGKDGERFENFCPKCGEATVEGQNVCMKCCCLLNEYYNIDAKNNNKSFLEKVKKIFIK